MISSINPYTGKTIGRWQPFDLQLLDTTLQACCEAQYTWAETDFDRRAQALRALSVQLTAQRDELARMATLEMGKTLASAKAEIDKCAWVCDYYAQHGNTILADEAVSADDDIERLICYQPLGVVLAIMPWNFPYWQVLRFLAPAVMAGNAVVLKHASNVPGCAQAIESLCLTAGLPENLVRNLLISATDTAAVIKHPLIAAVTFTGSTKAGRQVAATAGQFLKKTVLELGGSDPYLVLDDADLELAVEKCVTSRLLNNGQSCIAAKRFIVHNSLYGDFAEAMTAAMRRQRLGDPMADDTDIGPLAREDLCQELVVQVEQSIRLGAVLMCGGGAKNGFYLPSVLSEVRPGMPAFDGELFGPVASLIRARSDEEAVSLANLSMFGLGSAVFTRDLPRGRQIARKLQSGVCAVNDFVKSDPRMPFGGIKSSGYGRELGIAGIREFTNIKSLIVSPTGVPR
jgi:succinate-semialdehyde dehydrogenase / glutarate-semialdehyde dehydrogenase